MPSSLIGAVISQRHTAGYIGNPILDNVYLMANAFGPGLFLSASINQRGGNRDLIWVIQEIDGQQFVSVYMGALNVFGLNTHNGYGLMLLRGSTGTRTMTIDWPYPITFQRNLNLKVVSAELGVQEFLTDVVYAI